MISDHYIITTNKSFKNPFIIINDKMKGFQDNVVRSFRMIKRDMLELKGELLKVAENQERLDSIIEDFKKQKSIKKKVNNKRKVMG